MGKPVRSNVKRAETKALNTKLNKKVFTDFKDYCAYYGYPMNVLLESFMRQYTNGRFPLNRDDVMKWKHDKSEMDTLNTTFNKELYLNLKKKCKDNGYFVKYVVTAFMAEIVQDQFVLEYVNNDKIKR